MPSFKPIPIILGKLRRGDQIVPPQHFRAPKSPVQIGLSVYHRKSIARYVLFYFVLYAIEPG